MSDEKEIKPATTFHERVREAIKSGDVTMRPRWQFALKAALAVAGVVVGFLAVTGLLSIIIHLSWRSGAVFAPAFGFRGVRILLMSLPWLLIAASAAFLILLEMLLKRYAFAYRRPLLYSVAALVAVTVIVSLGVAHATFRGGFNGRGEPRRMPFGGMMYRHYDHRPDGVFAGRVLDPLPDGFTMHTRLDETLRVQIGPDTDLPRGADFMMGDVVIVLGERRGDAIRAFGVREIAPDDRHFFPPPPVE